MEEKITLSVLSARLAENTGYPRKICEDFLRELFITVSETLSKGENVKIKGLGTFRIIYVAPRKSVDVNTGESIEIPGHNKIVFAAAKELAEDINEPFSIFETVELKEEYEDVPDPADDDSVSSAESSDSSADETSEEGPCPGLSSYSIEESEEMADNEPDSIPSRGLDDNVPVSEEPDEEQNGNEVEEDIPQELEEISEEESSCEYESNAKRGKRSFTFLMGFACGLALAAIVCLAGWLIFFNSVDLKSLLDRTPQDSTAIAELKSSPNVKDTLESMVHEQVPSSDTVAKAETSEKSDISEAVPTRPSDEKKYDTISKTRYLTTMAKEYYGNYNLWPYIYEENKSILGHPDRIKPGTRVVIPPLSKYGVNPDNPEDIKKAKRMGVEIYARYK